MRPVAVVQHEPSVGPGTITSVLEGSGRDHLVVEAWRESEWPGVDDLGGLVVLGGTMNVDELDAYPFLRSSRALMADAIDRGVPMMGVCLGSQMLARILGGDVFRAEPRNAFFSALEVGGDPVVAPFAAGTPVLQFHEDTFSLPPDAVALARSQRSGLLQAFRYGTNAYGIQFHFEVDGPILEGWCRNIGDHAMRTEWGVSSSDLLAEAKRHLRTQERAGRALFEAFLAHVRPGPRRETAGPEGPAALERKTFLT